MGRLALGVLCVLGFAVVVGGCGQTYDCEDSCLLMRDCGQLLGTAYETCEVRCMQHDDDLEVEIDVCGECLDDNECSAECSDQCICALSLDLAEYPGVVCVR